MSQANKANRFDDLSIVAVYVSTLRVPWIEPPMLGTEVHDQPRELVVVEIQTAGGLVGMGYLQPILPVTETLVCCLREVIVPRLIGRNASAVEAIWQDLWKSTYGIGRMGVTQFAMSAIDVALWDVLGKYAGLPLHRLWGHHRSQVPIYGSGCWRGLGREGMVEKAQRYVAGGYRAIKMQVGHIYDRHQDVANVRAMRDAVGDGIEIMVDANMAWTADTAILMGRKFEDHDVYWLEEPVPAHDMTGYLRVARHLDMRVVGGESHFTRFDMRPFFEEGDLPILQPDVMRGGFTELRKIATLADTCGMTLAPHLFPELMIHLLASIPNGLWLEQAGWLDDLWVEPLAIDDGVATAPERPGHGLAFKSEIFRGHGS